MPGSSATHTHGLEILILLWHGIRGPFRCFFMIGLHQKSWIKHYIFQFFRRISLQNGGWRTLELAVKHGALTWGSRPTPSTGKSANFVGGDDPPPEISVFLFRVTALRIKTRPPTRALSFYRWLRPWHFFFVCLSELCVRRFGVNSEYQLPITNTNEQFQAHGRNATNREKSR